MVKSLALDKQLCFSIYAAGHAFNRFYKPLLEPLGLTYPQYLVLLALWEKDGLGIKAMGGRLDLDSGTLTPLLKRMENAGLVTRRRHEVDERQVLVHLTSKGKQLRAKAESFPERIGDAAQCSSAELSALRKMLIRLRQDLDAAA
ncbi:MAG: MarR family transcriptional regulator [Devosia sp.]